jgi:hypothetical protein
MLICLLQLMYPKHHMLLHAICMPACCCMSGGHACREVQLEGIWRSYALHIRQHTNPVFTLLSIADPMSSHDFCCCSCCCCCFLLPCLSILQMNVCTEVPAFQMQGAIMRRMAAPRLLNVVLAATALRLAAYAALPAAGTPWAVLPVELLHVSV